MRMIAIAASLAVLAACNQKPAEAPAAEEAAPAEPAAMTNANGTAPGAYSVADAKGIVRANVVTRADGTFTSTAPDGKTVEGTWAVVEGKTCFTTKEEGARAECWTEGAPAADGSFSATSDSGETVMVTPAAAAAPAAGAAPTAGQ